MSDAADQNDMKNKTAEDSLAEAHVLTEQFKATHDHSLVPRIQALRQAAHERRRVTPSEMQGGPSKFCVKCGTQLPPKSNYCSSCGVNQVTLAKAHPVVMRPFFKWLLACTILILGIIVLVAISGDNNTSSQPDETDIAVKVIDTCENRIRKSLKAPSTANFSGIWSTEVRGLGSGKYSAVGWVEAQNSFGAMLRSRYVCVAKELADDSFLVDDFSVDDE
jgi:predicted nucleic acid-binding Zn ribbon protein